MRSKIGAMTAVPSVSRLPDPSTMSPTRIRFQRNTGSFALARGLPVWRARAIEFSEKAVA